MPPLPLPAAVPVAPLVDPVAPALLAPVAPLLGITDDDAVAGELAAADAPGEVAVEPLALAPGIVVELAPAPMPKVTAPTASCTLSGGAGMMPPRTCCELPLVLVELVPVAPVLAPADAPVAPEVPAAADGEAPVAAEAPLVPEVLPLVLPEPVEAFAMQAAFDVPVAPEVPAPLVVLPDAAGAVLAPAAPLADGAVEAPAAPLLDGAVEAPAAPVAPVEAPAPPVEAPAPAPTPAAPAEAPAPLVPAAVEAPGAAPVEAAVLGAPAAPVLAPVDPLAEPFPPQAARTSEAAAIVGMSALNLIDSSASSA